MDLDKAISASLLNIAKHGDTDIFPFPFETHLFFDKPDECRNLLSELHKNFDAVLATNPPATIETLTQVGYTGFRWATLIEPFWNAYYLALVIHLAEQVESQRIPIDDAVVFSYRYGWNEAEAKLFKDITWSDYRKRAVELSQTSNFVVVTDIADFYPRIYHHRIENALNRLAAPGDVPSRIMKLLSSFSKNVSYGLPVGGPASRMLAELALNATDFHLVRRNIAFCRYADDYCIFCKNKSDAYEILVLLSEKLYNEGLVLQKKKTKILSAEEFRETARLLDPADANDPLSTEEQKLLNISIRFDPYSPTAVEDYDALKAAVSQIDILGILGREVAKTAIDPTVVRQAINAIRALEPAAKEGAIRTLLDHENLLVLLPVFAAVMRAVRGVYDELSDPGKTYVDNALVTLYDEKSHLLSVELNLSYYIQALAKRHSRRKEEILIEIFQRFTNPMLRRQVVLMMANWNCHYWLSDIKNRYGGYTTWEKRAIILSSYALGDEGKHWRDHTKGSWNPMESLVRDWFADRYQKNRAMPV